MSVSIRFKTKAAILIATVSLTACGTNASIAKKGATTSKAQNENKSPPQAGGETPKAPPTAIDEPKLGDAAKDKSAGDKDKKPAAETAATPAPESKTEAPAPTEEPTAPAETVAVAPPAPIVPEKGEQGAAGRDGAAGSAGKDGINGCGIRVHSEPLHYHPIESSDYKITDLPYIPSKTIKGSKGHAMPVLQVGQASPGTQKKFVQDSQVMFKFAVYLPPRAAMVHLKEAYIELDLTKVSDDSYHTTELICFLDQKTCSGEFYLDKYKKGGNSYARNVNQTFKNSLVGPVTSAFSDQFRGVEIEKISRGKKGKSLSLFNQPIVHLNIDDLIKGSQLYANAADFFYEGLPSNMPVEKDIKVVVADDTKVNNANLYIVYEEDSCVTAKLAKERQAPGEPDMVFTLEETGQVANTPKAETPTNPTLSQDQINQLDAAAGETK